MKINPHIRGMDLEWAWDVEDAISCLVQVANGVTWVVWKQHETDTRSIVTKRAELEIRKALSNTENKKPA